MTKIEELRKQRDRFLKLLEKLCEPNFNSQSLIVLLCWMGKSWFKDRERIYDHDEKIKDLQTRLSKIEGDTGT